MTSGSTLPFRTLDVFTEDRYGGNPLAVVLEADGLTTAALQRIAAEFNLSETISVQTPDDPAHMAKVRIFTPTGELPFAGHPTVGCAILLAGDDTAVVTLEEKAGLVPVTIERAGAQVTATLTAPVVPFVVDAEVSAQDAAAALGLEPGEIGIGAHRPGVAEGGPRFVFVPVASLDALARARPDAAAFAALEEACGTAEVYVYTQGTDGADYRARMFAPGIGIPEDPATGSASACLAAHLDACGLLADGTTDLVLHQGIEMGRPSRISVGIDRKDGALGAVRVGGCAVRVSEGVLEPPA